MLLWDTTAVMATCPLPLLPWMCVEHDLLEVVQKKKKTVGIPRQMWCLLSETQGYWDLNQHTAAAHKPIQIHFSESWFSCQCKLIRNRPEAVGKWTSSRFSSLMRTVVLLPLDQASSRDRRPFLSPLPLLREKGLFHVFSSSLPHGPFKNLWNIILNHLIQGQLNFELPHL